MKARLIQSSRVRTVVIFAGMALSLVGTQTSAQGAPSIESKADFEVGSWSDPNGKGKKSSFYRVDAEVKVPLLKTEFLYIGEESLGLFDLGVKAEHRPGSLARVEGPSFSLYVSEFGDSAYQNRFNLNIGRVGLDFEDVPPVESFRFGAKVTGIEVSASKDLGAGEPQSAELCGAITVLSYTIGENDTLGLQGDLMRHPWDVSLCGKVRTGPVELNAGINAGVSRIIPGREFEMFGRTTPEKGQATVSTVRLEAGVDFYLPKRASSNRDRKIGLLYAAEVRDSIRDSSFDRILYEGGEFVGIERVTGDRESRRSTAHLISAKAAF